jgi:hypothetical protein
MTDVDALHGEFLTIDENGQRLFVITSLDGSPQKRGTYGCAIGLCSPCARKRFIADHPGWRRHNVDDSRQRFLSGDQGSHRRQVSNGNLGGYEHTDPGFACGVERSPAVNANQRERRDCYSGRRGYRQLVTNFSRLASSKLTTTSTYWFSGAIDADSQTR